MEVLQSLPLFLFLSVASLALFSFIAVAAWAGERRQEREAYYKSEMLKKLAELQGPGATAAIEYLREQERIATRRRREGQKLGGLITAGVGIGMMVFLAGVARNDPEPAWLMGIIPVLIGVALLFYAYVLAPKD